MRLIRSSSSSSSLSPKQHQAKHLITTDSLQAHRGWERYTHKKKEKRNERDGRTEGRRERERKITRGSTILSTQTVVEPTHPEGVCVSAVPAIEQSPTKPHHHRSLWKRAFLLSSSAAAAYRSSVCQIRAMETSFLFRQ